ncbi:hypothetical protein ACWC5I_13935 [Kitasatospora sp. NPDC001574]
MASAGTSISAAVAGSVIVTVPERDAVSRPSWCITAIAVSARCSAR